MRKIIALVLFFCGLIASAKDDNFILRGYATRGDTTEWTPLDSVAVMISAVGDTADVKFKLLAGMRDELMTDKGGEVRAMVQGGIGKYILTLDREGYEPVVKEFERKYRDQSTVWIGTMTMQRERHKELDEVEVVATAIKMVMKGDTIVYNANAFNLAEGSMLDALIRQLPNAQLSAEGEITVNGRKINSLLINGKDFFNGDMDIAMKNLPSYTVKNIQVYDKSGEDDYLTQASQKLARKEDEENLVMDVVLKKEYSVGWMASIEAGYGTDNRWLTKLFGLGFTDNLRISAFGNLNNLKDQSSAGQDGNWGHNYGSLGEGTVEKGGLDYLYEPESKKFRANGSVVVSNQEDYTRTKSVMTLFYPTGDLYRRAASNSHNNRLNINTNHYFQLKGESVFFNIAPSVSWSRNSSPTDNRTATFTEMPVENGSRTEALDSVFARPHSERYNDILLTRLLAASLSESRTFNSSLNLNASIRHEKIPGRFGIYAMGNYTETTTDGNSLNIQHFGGANTNPGEPVNSNRFTRNNPQTGKFSGGANYTREFTRLDEHRSRSLRLHLATNYHYTFIANDYRLFEAEPQEGADPLPSLRRPEDALIDARNSYNSTNRDHNIVSDASLRFLTEPTAQVDSGLNPSFSAGISLSHKFRSNSLDYNTLMPTHELVLRRTNALNPSANIGFSSQNKLRYLSLGLRYSMQMEEPWLNLFLRNRESSNPLVIYEYNGDRLRMSKRHNVNINFSHYGRETHDHLNFYGGYTLTRDAIGNASIYNPETGVTVYKPMNINGNWNSYGNVYYSNSLGKRQQVQLGGNISGNYGHSVDFHTTIGSPERSLVKNTTINGGLSAGYKFKNGSNIFLNGSAGWNHSTGNRDGFREISAMTYRAGLSGVVELPWQMQLRTQLNMVCNTGYDVAEMNEAQWLWNASLTKSIMKGNLTFKLSANDILGQEKPYRLNVDSQGRYEVWTNTLSRYVMLTLLYRFNKHPKKRQ